MKKLIALVMALMMMCTLFTAQAESMCGGWTATADSTVTPEISDALNDALSGMVGCSYEPVAVLGTQVVAGTNYCLLCRLTPVVPDAVPHYALVYVWVRLDGTAELLTVEDVALEMPAEVDDSVADTL